MSKILSTYHFACQHLVCCCLCPVLALIQGRKCCCMLVGEYRYEMIEIQRYTGKYKTLRSVDYNLLYVDKV